MLLTPSVLQTDANYCGRSWVAASDLKIRLVNRRYMLTQALVTLAILIIISTPPTLGQSNVTQPLQIQSTLPSYPLDHGNFTIRVGLIGFSNQSVRQDSLGSYLPHTLSPSIQTSQLNFGVAFYLNYSVSMFGDDANQSLRRFLASNIVVRAPPNYLTRQLGPDSMSYAVIQAKDVDYWIHANSNQLGIDPTSYTILVANVTGISNYDHYYEASYLPVDANYAQAPYLSTGAYFPVVNWMISWGGNSRAYFIDLSAGSRDPSHDYTFRTPAHIPIQYFSTYRRTNNDTLSEYIADYISEAVRNIILPDYFLFPPLLGTYRLDIFFFDDTERILDTNFVQFLNVSFLASAMRKLVPYANCVISVRFMHLATDKNLSDQMAHSLISSSKMIGYNYSPLIVNYYDARDLYYYLKTHLYDYVGQTSTNTTIPIFVFALKSAGRIVTPALESLNLATAKDPDGQPMDAAVLAFPELAIVSASERQLFDWGLGLSHAVTQAAGHMMGLSVGSAQTLANAQPSVMSLQGYAMDFSQFEADSIQRAHADFMLSFCREQISGVQSLYGDSIAAAQLHNATVAMNTGMESYGTLNFQSAVNNYAYCLSTLDQLFQQHVLWLTQQMNSLGGGTVLVSMDALREGRIELSRAVSARSQGDMSLSWAYLSRASVDENAAYIAEEGYSSSRQAYLLTGAIVGLCIGLGLDRLITRVAKRERDRSEVVSETPPAG